MMHFVVGICKCQVKILLTTASCHYSLNSSTDELMGAFKWDMQNKQVDRQLVRCLKENIENNTWRNLCSSFVPDEKK